MYLLLSVGHNLNTYLTNSMHHIICFFIYVQTFIIDLQFDSKRTVCDLNYLTYHAARENIQKVTSIKYIDTTVKILI